MISDLTQNLSYVESVFVKASLQSKIFIVGFFFRPHNSDIELFIYFFYSLRQFNVEATDLIIGRDYFIDLLKVSNSDSLAVQFNNTNIFLSMVPTVTIYTRITRTSCTLLYNFWLLI